MTTPYRVFLHVDTFASPSLPASTISIVRRIVLQIVLACGWVTVTASDAHAQFPSDWSSLPTTVTHTATPYPCYAALTRTWASDSSRRILRDTFPVGVLRTTFQDIPASVSTLAKQCTNSVRVDAVPITEYFYWAWLLLHAGRETDAEALFQRALANPAEALVHQTDPDAQDLSTEHQLARQRMLIHLEALREYLTATPARLPLAVKHAEAINTLGEVVTWVQRMNVAHSIYRVALAQGDSALAQTEAQTILDIASSVGEKQSSVPFLQRRSMIVNARVFLNRETMLDSLRKSTNAYTNYARSLLSDLNIREEKLGTTFSPVESEFRFPASAILPKPQAVNLIIVDGGSVPWSPISVFAMARRLAKLFPALTIGYVTFTRGFMDQRPMPPADEAESRRKWAQEFYQAPVSVFVENTPFWNLPDPDHRRINQYSQLIKEYGGTCVVVDQAGMVFGAMALANAREYEARLSELIRTVLSR